MHSKITGTERIHHWIANLGQFTEPDLLASFRDSLGHDELTRLNRFATPEKRHQFLVSHGLLRRIFCLYMGETPGYWHFTIGKNGKPVLGKRQNTLGLEFNLSHSRSRLVIAISRTGQIGVDIEYSCRKKEVAKVAHRYFSPTETADLCSRAGHEREDCFYRYWTLKEAYIKARGRGLGIPLQSFSYSIQPLSLNLQESRSESREGTWNLWSLKHGADYHGAIAWWTARPIQAPGLSFWSYEPGDQVSPGSSQILQQSCSCSS